jgi:hypothetical protein
MRLQHATHRSFTVAVAAVGFAALVIHAAGPANFKPDGTFTGSTLAGWHVVGDADWKAQNGELIGTAKPGTNGGWLVMDKSFQDVQLFTNFRCTGTCSSGILLRAAKTPDGGMQGLLVSLNEGDTSSYAVALDARGKETARDRLSAPQRGGGGGGGNAARGAAPAAGGGAGGGRAQGGGQTPAAAPGAAQGAAPGAPAGAGGAGGRAGGGGGARGRGPVFTPAEWNAVNINLTATTLRTTFGAVSAVDEKDAAGYGPIALFAGSGEVHFKDLAWKDMTSVVEPKEQVSSRFTMQRISSLYYGWGAATADINHDGNLDIISGPFYYLGPSFTERRVYRQDRVYNPTSEFAPDMVNLAADFTGDGWPDILSSLGNRHMDLYVNPKGEARRWDKFSVLPTISTEIVLMKDLDKDGKPEIIFGQNAQAPGGAGYAWAQPDPANPTAVWTPHVFSNPGETVGGHGLGVGDINGDGRLDVVCPTGWYEQPAEGIAKTPWVFHPYNFGNQGIFGMGGGEMGVYDINGDGLTDVIAGSAHNWGLFWFEQKKEADGTRTFVEHRIMQDFSTENMGDVLFSELHAARVADMDGDGIPDFVTGKRVFSELENATGNSNTPNPMGAAVLYIFHTVRDPKAPGGARFEPELVHNKSGIGSSFAIADLNKDGKPDIVTATTFGTFAFLSKPGGRGGAPAPKK